MNAMESDHADISKDMDLLISRQLAIVRDARSTESLQTATPPSPCAGDRL